MFTVVNIAKFALNVLNLKNDSQKQLISNLNRIETQSIVNPSVLLRFLKQVKNDTIYTYRRSPQIAHPWSTRPLF